MKVSLNYLKRYLNFDLPPINELADVIGTRLGALEEPPVNLTDIYKNVLVVKVESSEAIEGSDHLSLCLISDGQKVTGIERDEKGLISVVCGAPNVKSGILAAWLPPGSVVPSSYSKEKFVLEARNIRGHLSNGMLASPKELALSDDHDGILIIESDCQPGDKFADIYELNDYLIDIENKMFTHRPDCFGLLGVAREVSGILGQQFTSPDWYRSPTNISSDSSLTIKIQNEIPEKVPRFSLLAIGNLKVEPSPLSIQSYLSRMGIRPVSNIVDLTNLIMLETGQPLHAYDYDKLVKMAGSDLTIGIRQPKPNEQLKLINGKEVEPTSDSILITANDKPIGLGGVMGGMDSEIDENTKTIILEAATFDMYAIRRTSMELGIFSDAVTRFTKGQSPLQTVRILSYAFSRVKELLPGLAASSTLTDDNHLSEDILKRDSLYPAITVSRDFINSRLGTDLPANEMASLLKNIECSIDINEENLIVNAPFWRTDLEIREDVVEEVGRLFGFDHISSMPLTRQLLATPKNLSLESKSTIRSLLSAAGANELLTHSFVSEKLIANASQTKEQAIEIANSLSPELKYYRLSLTPSLLAKVQQNIKSGIDKMAIFELGTYHLNSIMDDADNKLPKEYQSLSFVYASKHSELHAAYFNARHYLDYLLNKQGIDDMRYQPLVGSEKLEAHLAQLAAPFEPSRAAIIIDPSGRQLGVIGEYKASVVNKMKLPTYSAGFELDATLFCVIKPSSYKAISKFPLVKQDITIKLASNILFATLNDFLQAELAKLVVRTNSYTFKLASIYMPKDTNDSINYTFHLEIADDERTLKDAEVNNLLDKLASQAASKFKAERI